MKAAIIFDRLLLLEFFKFGQDIQVHSLDKFLVYVNNFIVKNFEIFFMDISNDIISGLKYLHENKVAIVMSNPQISYFQTHYTSTETEEFQIKKIICKITDFEEVRNQISIKVIIFNFTYLFIYYVIIVIVIIFILHNIYIYIYIYIIYIYIIYYIICYIFNIYKYIYCIIYIYIYMHT